ncbi:MAG: universal stress protein [Rhodospirillales bacterium]
MSDKPAAPASAETPSERTFLVVVDDSPELMVALRYASRRAKRTGGKVAMLYVIDPIEPQQWAAVGDLMKQEAREQAEEVVHRFSELVVALTGILPTTIVREGNRRDELLKLVTEDPGISVLVLAAATGPEGPGPLVSALASKYASTLRVPLTIVPGNLTEAQIDAIS